MKMWNIFPDLILLTVETPLTALRKAATGV